MDWAVCSRETERDYTWDNAHAGPVLAEYAQRFFAPALEGSITRSRFAAFLRCPGTIQDVILCISVSTNRRDFSHTPIRTLAFLRAETSEERDLLAAFFAECLRKPDAETLYNAESDIAQAVESLYQTKKPDDFLRFCRSLPSANGSGEKPTGRWEIRRDDAGSRQAMAESLPALIRGGKPFLIALTDRLPTDVLTSLGSMFDHATVHIFSKAVTTKAPLPGGGPNARVIAAAIGGVILLSALLVAAGRSCRNGGESSEAIASTNEVSRASGKGVVATNAPSSSGISATNALPLDGGNRESVVETWRDDSPASSTPAETETTETALKPLYPQTSNKPTKENQP